MNKSISMILMLLIVVSCSTGKVMTDPRDNQSYKIAKINGLWWTMQNMRFEVPGFQFYNDERESNPNAGKQYNWEQAKQVCPPGWRLPSEQELIGLLLPYGKISYSGDEPKYEKIFGEYDPSKTESTYFKLIEDKKLNIPVFKSNSIEDQRTMLWSSVLSDPERAYAIYWRSIDQYIEYNSVHFSSYPIEFFGFCRCVKEK